MARLRYKNFTQKLRPVDWLWFIGLLIAALILFTLNLGGVALRDWDESTVAQVAREISLHPIASEAWIYPTLGGEPYLNKPPFIHWLIALNYRTFGVNEWTSRLPGAILTALSVPLLYSIGREIFPQRITAIFASLVYLTMLPMVRHGRLAMLDGAVVSFFILTIWCVLRSRRNLRYCLGIGVSLGLICFTKGLIGLLLGAIALLFLLWDTPRLLTSWYLWLGLAIGTAPVISWYTAQWLHYGSFFTQTAIVNQSFSRIWQGVENHAQPPWYYLLEIVKYSFPWLLFLPQGFRFAWTNSNVSYSKLIVVWLGVYLLAISVMTTKLPWYVLPIYPAFALAVGVQLTQVWHQPRLHYSKSAIAQARTQGFAILTILALISWGGSLYFSLLSPAKDLQLQIILTCIALTMTIAAILAQECDRQFIVILFWGSYLSIALFVTSRHWVWELAEAYPVKPVAAMIQSNTAINQKIYTSFSYHRPSLDFYSDRQVIPATNNELQQYWQQSNAYLLIEPTKLKSLGLKSVQRLGTREGWTLIKRQS
jgi:4-amino-4-deoxy-L-arabinose transferase-like glycosyltransferase